MPSAERDLPCSSSLREFSDRYVLGSSQDLLREEVVGEFEWEEEVKGLRFGSIATELICVIPR